VEDLELKNKSLLAKWLYKLTNEDGMWQELLHTKYLSFKPLSHVSAKAIDLPFRKGLMNVTGDFFVQESFVVGNGLNIRFCKVI
jgi:hypothetical protein